MDRHVNPLLHLLVRHAADGYGSAGHLHTGGIFSHKGAVHLDSLCSRRRCTLPDRIYSSSWLVAPRPLISRQTSSPGFRGISPRISPTDSSARSSAVFTGPFHTPGSPWIPMPKAISSSARVKLEWPISGMTQGVRAKPTVLVFSFAFLPRPILPPAFPSGQPWPLRIYT